MKFSKKIYNVSIYNLKKRTNNYLKRIPKKQRVKFRQNYEHILLLKQIQNDKFCDRFINSTYFKLAFMATQQERGIRFIPPQKRLSILLDKMIRIRKWCERHKTNPDEWIKYYKGLKK